MAQVKDMDALKKYKARLTTLLMESLKITENDAISLIKELEKEDFLKIEAPLLEEKPITFITNDKHLTRTELGMTSHKLGNIFINTYLNWKKMASLVGSSVGTALTLPQNQPLVSCSLFLACIFSASGIVDIKLSENEVAIIMAIQDHNKNKSYKVKEDQCLYEANKILEENGYNVMNKYAFSDSITKLIKYRCVEQMNGILKLKEKVWAAF